MRLTASNQSAARILEADFDWLGQYPLPEWLVWQPELEPLVTMLYQHFDTDGDWQQQVELTDDRLLLVRASQLPDTASWVVVFDDVTDLVHAQRDAAWREVARRLAHEIRNPLTPIQLSSRAAGHEAESPGWMKRARISWRARPIPSSSRWPP